ncbi:MAG: tautomerase family protein [Candidatus Omnitrophica bacterium]|nr:tautomerase family protein [Candidatus Omnitrophota bacterium]
MPIVSVEWIEGRTPQQKARLAEAITNAFVDVAKVSKDQVWIVFRDVKRSDWAMAGRLLAENTPARG